MREETTDEPTNFHQERIVLDRFIGTIELVGLIVNTPTLNGQTRLSQRVAPLFDALRVTTVPGKLTPGHKD
jgi:hypothetical protein